MDESGWADGDNDDDNEDADDKGKKKNNTDVKLKILEEENKLEQKQMVALLVKTTETNQMIQRKNNYLRRNSKNLTRVFWDKSG